NASMLQTLLVALIVSVSAILSARHVAPGLFRLLQTSMARALSRSERSTILRGVGLWLQPLEAKKGGCGTGLGCGSCGGCGTSPALPVNAIPLKISPRPTVHR
ncbi:MAG: DUF6587 family protein, partial [Dokdonella sp.]